MNSQLKNIVDPFLYNSFLELSKDDIVLQKTLQKTTSIKEFVNGLLASIICIKDREQRNQNQISELISNNPQIKKIIELKNDTSILSGE